MSRLLKQRSEARPEGPGAVAMAITGAVRGAATALPRPAARRAQCAYAPVLQAISRVPDHAVAGTDELLTKTHQYRVRS